MVLSSGAAMLLLGASSALQSLHLGHFIITFKGVSIEGVVAAALIAAFLAMGGYLFLSALGKIRRLRDEKGS